MVRAVHVFHGAASQEYGCVFSYFRLIDDTCCIVWCRHTGVWPLAMTFAKYHCIIAHATQPSVGGGSRKSSVKSTRFHSSAISNCPGTSRHAGSSTAFLCITLTIILQHMMPRSSTAFDDTGGVCRSEFTAEDEAKLVVEISKCWPPDRFAS